MTDDFLFAQHVRLNSPDFIFAFWGSVAWVPLISFYFSGVQPHLGAPQGMLTPRKRGHARELSIFGRGLDALDKPEARKISEATASAS